MPEFTSFDGIRIHYEIAGSGEPVLLLHSYPFDARVWSWTGVADAILATGRSVLAPDRRGSGKSDRPHSPSAYAHNACARDVSFLLDHLGLNRVDLGAYSLGAAIGLRVLQADNRIARAVLGGVGRRTIDVDPEMLEAAARQLEEDTETLSSDALQIRRRIDRVGGDRLALAAMWRGPFAQYGEGFQHVAASILLVTGEFDTGFGDPIELAQLFPRASVVRPATDHDSTMDHPEFTRSIVRHLCYHEPVD